MNIRHIALKNKIIPSLLIVAAIIIFYYISTVHYILFHCIVEFSTIAIALSLFLIAWNLKEQTDNRSLVYLGIAYFFVSILNFAHTLSYKGMHIFEYDYYASDLWIAARYMESISLFIFFTLSGSKKHFSYGVVFGIYFCVTCCLLASIYFWKIFPVCFIEEQGQTDFKIYSEYVICAILLLSLFPLMHNRKFFGGNILKILCGAVLFAVVSEFSFSLYSDVFGFSNFTGHIFKITSLCLIYKAIIENSLKHPLNLIFKELKDKESLLNLTQKIAKIGGWNYDLANDKMDWTDEVYNIREIPPDSRIDLEKALSFYTNESARKIKNTFQKLATDGGSDDLELEMITAKSRKIWVRVTFAAEMKNGKTNRISGIIQDITERKNMEELREDFERITRHDLKTPLNSIFVASQLLDSGKLSSEEGQKLILIIQDAVYKLLDMINLSLSLFRVEEGAYNLTPLPFNFKDLLKKVIYDHRFCAEIKKVAVHIDDKASAFIVNGEENLMYSMLSNLYKNAIEASPSGGKIKIKIDKNTDGYAIEINNAGAVPHELRDRFFDKYATSGKKNGTGLGTYSAKLITELHKGKISMQSSEELGTSIFIELPESLCVDMKHI